MELVAKCDRFSRLKHSTAFPLAFTEHGAIMAGRMRWNGSTTGNSRWCSTPSGR